MAKILVIDDDRMVRDTLRAILLSAGHEIVLANDGKQGMTAFTNSRPNLVITDVLMPEKEGIETIAEMRKMRPEMPIIAISGGGRIGNMGFLKIAESFGANQTLAKPFEPRELIERVTDLLRAT